MKFIKKTAFWIVALVAIAGAMSFIDERADVAKKIEEANLKLLPYGVDEIGEFWTKSREKGVQMRAVKEKDGWWLAVPLRARGDQGAIDKLLKNVVKTRKDSVLFETPTPEKQHELGLDNPDREFGIKVGGKDTIIELGDKGPTLNIAFARFKGEQRIFRIHSDVRKEAGSSVYMLRDKTILEFDPSKMRRLEIDRKGRDRVVVSHDQGRWNLVEPMETMADQVKVLQTLFDIKNNEVKEFIDEEPSDLKAYGLDDPEITVAVLEEGADKPRVLYIGARDRAKRGFYARNEGKKNVFLAEEDLVKLLRNDAVNWKEPD